MSGRDKRIETLRRLPRFATLPRTAVRSVAHNAELIDVDAGDELLARGSRVRWVFLVAEGRVALMDGSRTRATFEPGDLFGAIEALELEPAPADLRAVTSATVLVIERRRYLTVLATVPAFALLVLRGVAAGPSVTRRRRARAFERRSPLAVA